MRVVGDNVEQPLVLPIREALKLADSMELDLIEISPKAEPPVCRFFRGRSIVFKEQGEILLLRFATDLEEVAKVEMMPKLDGKKMNMMLAPKTNKK